MTERDDYPRLAARTRRFTLGEPRSFAVSDDGSRVLFLRAVSGTDPRTALWCLDVATGRERAVVDPTGQGDEDLPLEERVRRERVRETAQGVVAFSIDRDANRAAYAAAGRLAVVDVATGDPVEVPPTPTVYDPRIDPTGRRIAYVSGADLRMVDLAAGSDSVVVAEPGPDAYWGRAEHAAAEEMDRARGFWWSPDGESLLVAHVDESEVPTWWIADPAHPSAPPRPVRFPAAGAPNATVTLHHVRLDGSTTPIAWGADELPYLARVTWSAENLPLIQAQSRDQRRVVTFEVDIDTGATRPLHDDRDPIWVELFSGVPVRCGDRVVRIADLDGARRLLVGDDAVTDAGVYVRSVVAADDDGVVFTASYDDPTQVHVARWSPAGVVRLTEDDGVHVAVAGSGVTVIGSAGLAHDGLRYVVRRGDATHEVRSVAERPPIQPAVRLLQLGGNELPAGLVLPRDHDGVTPLPVLLDPYGGPHAQRVLQARRSWLEPQWFADQGFAVLVVDGRGTPGRGPEWERLVHHDLASTVDDQVDALLAAAKAEPVLDLSRVAIRGWSFGGYLSALAVLRHPDVIHAAIVGAPVIDWALYDTHYTERYLGTPADNPDVYARNGVLDEAPSLCRPILLIHGLADDNVVAANSLQFSQRLTEAGRAHRFLPLPGVTHMTPQEEVAENLLKLQVEFLRDALGAGEGNRTLTVSLGS